MVLLNTMIFNLISVAFITLMERKILGYTQMRLGPNKVGILGLLQPFSDAIKLYSKEKNLPNFSTSLPFFFSPCVSLTISMFVWICLPYYLNIISLKIGIMILLSVLGMSVYPILIAGWSSNSIYSLLGGIRSLAQTISYEVSLTFILFMNLFICASLNMYMLISTQKIMSFSTFLLSFFMWLISMTAELNRTPFDFAEGESELVSGFNTEYSSGSFAIIFMSEYMMIMFFSVFTSVLFFGVFFNMNFFFMTLMLMFLLIWTRSTFPRYRYDKLMNLCWKIILPLSIINIFFSILVLLLTL
nr:NADH dehydrogenase subunit 1 [Aptinothrips stylifer]